MSGLMRVADLITHPDSRVGYAVNYDGLVCDPESELQKLCQYLEFPYSPLMLTATQALHVPRGASSKRATRNISGTNVSRPSRERSSGGISMRP